MNQRAEESEDSPPRPSAAPPGAHRGLPETEALNRRTATDPTDPHLWLSLFESSDDQIARALAEVRAEVLTLSQLYANALRPQKDAARDGRLVAIGAGTSGRLALLDAAEWPPTFGLEPGRVIARLAGGAEAMERAVEGAEDDADAGEALVRELDLGACDLLVGISASGSAAYVAAAVREAARRGCKTARLTCATPPDWDSQFPDRSAPPPPHDVVLTLGAELVAGSTRLAAATATHRVLQRASVLCALELGWIYRGRMVEMRPTNQKLRRRAEAIVADLTGASREVAAAAIERSNDDLKVAIVSLVTGAPVAVARAQLEKVDRDLRSIPALEERFTPARDGADR